MRSEIWPRLALAGLLVAARAVRWTAGESGRLHGALCESQSLEGGEALGKRAISVKGSVTAVQHREVSDGQWPTRVAPLQSPFWLDTEVMVTDIPNHGDLVPLGDPIR